MNCDCFAAVVATVVVVTVVVVAVVVVIPLFLRGAARLVLIRFVSRNWCISVRTSLLLPDLGYNSVTLS